MTNEREERIRRRAHELWEQQGRPHGRHEDHWQQAMRDVDMEAEEALRSESMKGVSADPAQDRPSRGRRRQTDPGPATPVSADEAAQPKGRKSRRVSASGDTATGEPSKRRRAPTGSNGADGVEPTKTRRTRKAKEEVAPAAVDSAEQA